ncbi:hypothetical protein XbC2_568 [Xanthomonas phage XbC2]|nr:hypothetical protein XbC2_568 [Xanthomonas phage XbC2]
MKINNLDESVTYRDEHGRKHNFDWYNSWNAMHSRTEEVYQSKFPTYIGCTVCEEWNLLSNYKKFYEDNYSTGYVLDKDLLVFGNKVYSPDTCVFVPEYVNAVISLKHNNTLMKGVYFVSNKNIYHSRGYLNGKRISLGYYKTELEAHQAWQKHKIMSIHNVIEKYKCEEKPLESVITALQLRINMIQSNLDNNTSTDRI